MAFVNGFEKVIAGTNATTTAQFILEPGTSVNNLSATYQLLNAEGDVFSSGVGSEVTVNIMPDATVVQSTIIVPVPSAIPVNELGSTYQVRIILLREGKRVTSLYSNLEIISDTSRDLGAADSVVLINTQVITEIVVDVEPTDIQPLLYFGNDLVPLESPLPVSGPVPIAEGFLFSTDFIAVTGITPASLVPYNVVWQYKVNKRNYTEASAIYIVTPSILQAVKDLMAKINKARTSLGLKPTFSTLDALVHLRRGADDFNGFSDTTTFTMTNATGPVRSYWLAFSEVSALRSQYMFEGESAFDYSGQAIQLTVQREQYYETLASQLENQYFEPAKQFKAILSKRGNTGGDGNVNPNKLNKGAIGTVGITLSPVSVARPWNPNSWLGGQRTIF